MKNKFLKISSVLCALAFMASCNDNDYTNDSTLSVTAPSLSVSLGFPNSQTLVEQEISYDFTVSISEKQIVDVVVYLEQTAGTATDGLDYTIPHSIRIPKGSLSASDVITIHADELIEDTETATIQIGTGAEANVQAINGQTVNFSISNLTADDLVINMSWATGDYKIDGVLFTPIQLADLRLLLTDASGTILTEVDQGGFETLTLPGALADGDYFLSSKWFSAYNLGDQGFFDVDLNLQFDQVGVINGDNFDYSSALNSEITCEASSYNLAKVTKSGNSYTITRVGEASEFPVANYVGTWSGDGAWSSLFGYPTQMVTTMDMNGDLWLDGATYGWFEGWWGEVITSNTAVKLTVGPCGDFTVAEQPYLESTWNGAVQPSYNLKGSGRLFNNGGTLSIEFFPILVQGGSDYDGANFGGPVFVENATL